MQRRRLIQLGARSLGLSIAGVPLELLAQDRKGGTLNALVQPEPPGLMMGIIQNGPTQLVSGNIYVFREAHATLLVETLAEVLDAAG